MKIVCKLKRTGGTSLTIGKTDYNFMPDEDGVHVCEVKNESHIKRLLSIKEAYVAYSDQPSLEPVDEDYVDPDVEIDLEDDDTEEDGDELNPETMDNDALFAWATEAGINHKSKQSITDYIEDNELEVELLKNDNLAAMLRKTLTADLAQGE